MKQFLSKRKSAYKANKFMLAKLENFKKIDLYASEGMLYDFKHTHLNTILGMLKEGKTKTEVAIYLEIAFAKFYHKLSDTYEVQKWWIKIIENVNRKTAHQQSTELSNS